MSNTTAVKRITEWTRDPHAYDPGARKCRFTFGGQTFAAHTYNGDNPEQWPLVIREVLSGKYVATVSNWATLPTQLAARVGTGA